jgi:hypothetical protein
MSRTPRSYPDGTAPVQGVTGLGLPDVNGLGWRWRDAVICITKRVPNEPTFSVAKIIDQVAPLPIAGIHSTNDEFVALPALKAIPEQAREPNRLWVIQASHHRCSGAEAEFGRRLLEAVAWVKSGGR